MAVVEVVVVPLGTKTPSVSKVVARVIEVLKEEPDLKYESTAMGTIIEGDLDRLMQVARRMHESAFSDDVMRVETLIRIDDRRDREVSIKGKLESLKREQA
ncbi:MAG: MTH1187 family thiamine-binding protein [Dehalococcoidia bacterium]